MIVYIESPKESIEKLLRINEFSKVAGYKININGIFIYYNEQSKNETGETIPLATEK